MTKKIGLLIVATRRYREFLAGLIASADRFFFPAEQVTKFVFSDSAVDFANMVHIPVVHEKWPGMTLKRYHLFTRHAAVLSSMDYLFYIDADMRFVGPCTNEILPDTDDRLVGVEHPAYYRPDGSLGARTLRALSRGRWGSCRLPYNKLPFEKNPLSLACVPATADAVYYAGGFNGGFTDSFLTMARRLRDAVDRDSERGIMAIWHDESHLNRYFHEHTPKRLTPSYCYPEDPGYGHLRHLNPVVLALSKDHAYFRNENS